MNHLIRKTKYKIYGNIKMDLREAALESVDWFHSAQVNSSAFVNMVTNCHG